MRTAPWLPPTPHTIADVDACRTQCRALCAVRGVCAEGRTDQLVQGVSCKHVSEHRAPRPSCICPRYQFTTTNCRTTELRLGLPACQSIGICVVTQTKQAPNYTHGAREEAQCGTCRLGTLCLNSPFGKPRPKAESLKNAPSRQLSLMPQCHVFT